MLTERSIINFLIWVAGLIIGPYIAVSAVSYNFVPLGAAVGCALIAFIFGVMKDKMCMLPLLGFAFLGKITLIPLKPAPAEAGAFALVLYYLVAYTALQRKLMKTGPMFFFLPILVIAAIILYHEHNFGLRAAGGGLEGGRGALFMLLAVVTYLAGVSVNTPSPTFFARVPLYCLLVTVLSVIPYALTTYVPSLTPIVFIFVDYVNASAFANELSGAGDIVRNQGQSAVGSALAVYLLAYYPIFTWWQPRRWWVLFLFLGCTALVVLGGFRSGVVGFGMSIVVATWCHYGWRVLTLLPVAALALFGAVAAQNSGAIHLPLVAQRSLAFLPGNWDREVTGSTESSNEFRDEIQSVYLKEEARNSPLFGNGFSYNGDDFAKYVELEKYQETSDHYYRTKSFVTGKIFHVGWISVYDGLGIVGGLAFIALCLAVVTRTAGMIFGPEADHKSPLFPLRVWMLCNTLPSFIFFFALFGDVKQTFPFFCYYAILWTHLARLDRQGYASDVPVRDLSLDLVRTQHAVPG